MTVSNSITDISANSNDSSPIYAHTISDSNGIAVAIYGNGHVKANSNSNRLFYGIGSNKNIVKNITFDFTNLFTDNVEIAYEMFMNIGFNNTNLKTINIIGFPNNFLKNADDMENGLVNLFRNFVSGCNTLTNVDIPLTFPTGFALNAISLTGAFEGFCSGTTMLEEFIFPKFPTNFGKNAVYVDSMFRDFLKNASSLKELDFPAFPVGFGETTLAFDYMFENFASGCTTLTKIIFPEFPTKFGKSLRYMGQMFQNFANGATNVNEINIYWSKTDFPPFAGISMLNLFNSFATDTDVGNFGAKMYLKNQTMKTNFEDYSKTKWTEKHPTFII